MKRHFFYFKEIGVGEFKKMGEGPKHISEDCIQQCAMLCLNIPGTYNDEHNGIGIYYRILHNNVSLYYEFYFISIFHKDCDSVKCEVGNKCVLGQFVPLPTCSVHCQEDFIWVLDEKGMIK